MAANRAARMKTQARLTASALAFMHRFRPVDNYRLMAGTR
jgi:hypothetical protein